MRLSVIAFLIGILSFQQLRVLPDIRWSLLLFFIVPVIFVAGRLRFIPLLGGGFLWALLHANLILTTALPVELEKQDIVVIGIIADIPQQLEEGFRFKFDIIEMSYHGEPESPPGRVLLSWYGHSLPRLVAGDEWRLKVRLKRPRGFMNPGGFDYEGWLFQQHLRATGYVRDDELNQRVDGSPQAYPLQRFRQTMAELIDKAIPDGRFNGIISALAIGERRQISASQWQTLTRTGTNHLVAISGLHIGLVAGLVFLIMRLLWSRSAWLVLRWPSPKAAAMAALLAAAAYAALAGFSIPTRRALIMVAVVMGSIIVQRHRSPAQTLAIALFVVLLFDPLAVMSAGFWLSFAAVAVILFGMGGRGVSSGLWWRWGRIHLLVAIGLLPLLLVLFQRMPLLSPLANFIAVPTVSLLIVPLVLLGCGLLLVVPPLGVVLLKIAALALAVLWPLLEWLANLDVAQWTQHAPLGWTLLPALVGVMLLLAPQGFPARWLGLLWLAPMLLIDPPRPAEGELWFTVFDVGQGLATVVRTSDHVMVYDSGPRFSARFNSGDAIILPYFNGQGIKQLDTLVIGHGDNDHIGGAEALLQGMTVRRIISSVPERLPQTNAESCDDLQHWQWNGIEFRMLHPLPEAPFSGNNKSCVLRISNAAGSILLTGDIEKGAERYLVDHYGKALASDIIVVPHHGSKTSSTVPFISAVAADYAVFPVGYLNRYGFPKAEIVARYSRAGATLLDTASNGAITFRLSADGIILPPESYRELGRRYWHSE